jgi:general stress protein 26
MAPKTSDWMKFWDMIKDIKYGMFTARHGDGRLHSHPMTTLNRSDDRGGVLWFFMSRNCAPALDISRDPEVNIAYSHPGSDWYISVSGKARVVDDLEKKKALWSPMVQGWFPEGVSDPGVALVAVTIEHVEYWDVDSNKAVKLYEMAKATITGTRPNLGEHREMHAR